MARRRSEREYDPFAEFDRMFDDMRRRMDDLMRSASGQWSWEEPTGYSEVRYVERPRKIVPIQEGDFRLLPANDEAEDAPEADEEEGGLVDIIQKGEDIIVLAELPCASKENVTATAKGKRLHILVERETGCMERSVDLPAEVRPSSLTAECRNGVVMVTMRKKAPRKPRAPKIKAA
ncbi:MAG: Hsp20/alpha crystallin family protein [Methanomassiliicoccales archaeon PtaU1.Bin124]|nr:MAG: Hsp20/alpha crystallin family protein [Methanomassiliicoccales archaeon PtaU1.Bin124]